MISIKAISVAYDRCEVLNDISLELNDGEVVALLGPNGAGKTTLIRALNGGVPLARGEILLNNRLLSEFSRHEIAREIAVVAQENETKFPVTVLEFVLAGRFASRSRFGWETDEGIAIALHALKDCHLAPFSDHLMNQLSGGERQRVVLARALATGAKVLLLDEPTANLDLAHQAMMLRLVRERTRSGASAIVITHDLNLAAQFADRVVLLKEGNLFAAGRPESVLTAVNVSEVYLVNVLLDQNPSNGKLRVTTVF